MKIIYLHQYFKTPFMPGGTRSYEMARRLVEKGHEVHVITSWQGEAKKKGWFEEVVDGIYVHWLPVAYSNEMSYSRRIRAFFEFSIRACFRASKIGGDIVFATSTPLTIAIPGVFASRTLKIPMVFEVRDLWPELPIAIGALKSRVSIFVAKELERFAYRNSARIIALSPGMADGIVQSGYPEECVAVVPNSCDISLFGGESLPENKDFFRGLVGRCDERVVLYPGTLGYINDVGYLVDVAVEAARRDAAIKFVVIGDGAEYEIVKEKADSLGVLGKVFYIFHAVPKSDVVEAFCSADLIVSLFAPIKEMDNNSANKFFDALASGKPVAINYGGWQKDIIDESECGIVLDRDATIAAEQLVNFFSDKDALRKYSKSALSLAKKRFNRDLLADNLEAVLLQAVSGNSKMGGAAS